MALVASVHVDDASHASVGATPTVVADVDSVFGEPPPVENVVDVVVIFQPAPEPVASPISRACVVVTVWSKPVSVAVKLTLGGVDTNASDPAEIVAVAAVPSGRAAPPPSPAPATTPPTAQ